MAKAKRGKKEKPQTQRKGRIDSETHGRIVSAMKRVFSRSPTAVQFLRKYRKEEVWFKQNGERAKKPHVFYPCFKCGGIFKSTEIQIDHRDPVIPLNIPSKHFSYDSIAERLFCDEENLQILCRVCHTEKSQIENSIRREWKNKEKHIVYININDISGKLHIDVHSTLNYDEMYGKKNHSKYILYVFTDRQLAEIRVKELSERDSNVYERIAV